MFIQVIQGTVRDPELLHRQMDDWRDRLAPGATGFLGGTYGLTDDNEFIGVVRFETKEAAERNSNRPEQGEWWAATEPAFDGPASFHDCADVMLMLGGGSDEAQFVQVIQGRLSDPAGFRDFMSRPMDLLHSLRPEILGGTIAIDDDGFFTQTVAFKSEAEARAGEQKEPPEDMRRQMEELGATMHDVSYHDLHHPWFETAGRR